VTNIVTDEPDVCGGKRVTAVNEAWHRKRLVEGVSVLNSRVFPPRCWGL
jgi:hypothetical protein